MPVCGSSPANSRRLLVHRSSPSGRFDRWRPQYCTAVRMHADKRVPGVRVRHAQLAAAAVGLAPPS